MVPAVGALTATSICAPQVSSVHRIRRRTDFVHLVGFNSGDLFVLGDVVTNLCRTVRVSLMMHGAEVVRLVNCFRVPSEIDSAIWGTLTTWSASGRQSSFFF